MKLITIFFTLCLTLLAGDIDPKPFKSIPMLSKQHINIVKVYDHGLIYELTLEINTPRGSQLSTAYVTKDKKVVILGEALNAKTGESIKRPLDMKTIRENADIVYGTGKDEYIVFTDPECPYCVRFEEKWPSLAEKVTLLVYFMPLPNHHNATKMSYHVMKQANQKAKVKALLDMAEGDRSFERLTMTQKISELFSQKLKDNQTLATQFGVRGTPSVFDTKGKPVNWPNLGK
ncbi:thioredoxin fold domain-containing protein [Sulfurimonas sp. MAG313]|nr:thioredoxin fold domain-containing protein [Sulfurimonas sp. MAG313]MDF1881633.1 thioredoxin fold domain-containing protein [Sulfurimonas sp. MAG313]